MMQKPEHAVVESHVMVKFFNLLVPCLWSEPCGDQRRGA